MNDTQAPSGGLFASLRRLAENGLRLLQSRAELVALELHEEKSHLIEILLWIVVLLFFGLSCLLALTAALVMLAPEGARIYVVGGFSFLYLTGAIWAFARLKARLRMPAPFSETIREMKKDGQWLFHE